MDLALDPAAERPDETHAFDVVLEMAFEVPMPSRSGGDGDRRRPLVVRLPGTAAW